MLPEDSPWLFGSQIQSTTFFIPYATAVGMIVTSLLDFESKFLKMKAEIKSMSSPLK